MKKSIMNRENIYEGYSKIIARNGSDRKRIIKVVDLQNCRVEKKKII